jgi:hypothetical protein
MILILLWSEWRNSQHALQATDQLWKWLERRAGTDRRDPLELWICLEEEERFPTSAPF